MQEAEKAAGEEAGSQSNEQSDDGDGEASNGFESAEEAEGSKISDFEVENLSATSGSDIEYRDEHAYLRSKIVKLSVSASDSRSEEDISSSRFDSEKRNRPDDEGNRAGRSIVRGSIPDILRCAVQQIQEDAAFNDVVVILASSANSTPESVTFCNPGQRYCAAVQ